MRATILLANRHLFVLLACALAVSGEQSRDERRMYAIASRFVPRSMARASAASPNERSMRIAAAEGVLDASGRKDLVAVYANSLDGAVRVLAPRANGSYRLAGEASGIGMAGDIAHVELKDVDGDGFKEILASFDGLRGPYSEWILKWNGKRFIDLTPTVVEDGVRTSALCDAVFDDLDGDGKLELVGSNPYNSTDPSDVYSFRKGSFQKTGTLVFWKRYVGAFRAGAETFDVRNFEGCFTVTVVNGDDRGAHRVTDASVLLNGEVIAVADDIAMRPITKMVHLRESNEIDVLINNPRETLVVSIAPADKGATPVTK
jgi:hypothetical protein